MGAKLVAVKDEVVVGTRMYMVVPIADQMSTGNRVGRHWSFGISVKENAALGELADSTVVNRATGAIAQHDARSLFRLHVANNAQIADRGKTAAIEHDRVAVTIALDDSVPAAALDPHKVDRIEDQWFCQHINAWLKHDRPPTDANRFDVQSL